MVESTSIETYEALKESGQLGELQSIAYRIVKERPGRGYRELQKHFESVFRRSTVVPQIQPRLSELEDKGLIEKGERVKCPYTGRMVHSWQLADPDRDQYQLFEQ